MPDRRYEAVDFLRAASICAIVCMHLVQGFFPDLPTLAYQAVALGGTGAHVFFFCSGLGLYASHLAHPLAPGRFYLRRLTRVYLPYVPVVLASACLPALCIGVDRLGAVLAHLFLYKMFLPAYAESLGLQLWFVSTIIQLYLLFPLLTWAAKRLGMRRLFALALAVSVAWWCFTAVTGLYVERVWNSFCAQFIWEFVLGMAAADCLHRGKIFPLRPLPLAAVALTGLGLQAVLALWGGYPWRLFNDIPALFGFGAALLFVYALAGKWLHRPAVWLSGISYAWYLTHILVFTLTFVALEAHLPRPLTAVLALALSLAAAWGYDTLWGAILHRIRRKNR